MIEDILSRYETTQGSLLLAQAALASSPIPQLEGQETDEPSAEVFEILSAARRQLNIREDDYSPRALSTVDNLLADILIARSLAGSDQNQLMIRAAQAGRLLPKDYLVELPPALKLFFSLGIRPSHIEDVVMHPDALQHVMDEKADITNKQAMSIFYKYIKSKHAASSFHLIVLTHRAGRTQVAQSAWRIYPSEVEISDNATPVDYMKAMVETYGVEFKFNGVTTNFVLEHVVGPDEQVRYEFPQGETLFISASRVATPASNNVQVGLIYCIDLAKYREALSRAGLKLPPLPRSPTGMFTNTYFPTNVRVYK